MYLKKMFMDEMGSLSYLIGCSKAKVACVVDPRKKGVSEYLNTASQYGMKITHIFDTHARSDYPTGNMELKLRTGAELIYLRHSAEYIKHCFTREGDTFDFGDARLVIINSPIHNTDANSIMVIDTSRSNSPWLILNRNSLFVHNMQTSVYGNDDISTTLTRYLDDFTDTYPEPAGVSLEYNDYSKIIHGAGMAASI